MNDLDYLGKNVDEFKERYAAFAECVPRLAKALTIALAVPEVTGHPQYLVLGLSRLSIDRFEDVLILCFQRRGEGAMPLVRAMFEGLVNASYINEHPERADDFIGYTFRFIKKVQTQAEQLNQKEISVEHRQMINDAIESFSSPTKHDWIDRDLVTRAKDVGLGEYVVLAYYRTIEVAHPSMIHLYSLSKQVDGKRLMFGASAEFADQKVREALIISHRLAIEVLILLHKTFGNDELAPLIENCLLDYSECWVPVWNSQAT